MKKYLLILLALASLSLWAGNSIFSYYGFPVRYYGRDIYSLGMGDSGSSDSFRYNTGFANPALRNIDNKSLFGTGIIAGYTYYDSEYQGIKRSFRDDALDFPYFSVSIPVKRQRLGFQFNSLASGMVKNQVLLPDSTLERQECEKYLFRADIIYSYRIHNLNLGVSGNYYFGHDKRTFEQSSGENTVHTRESLLNSYKNPTLTFGAVQSFESHSMGAFATLPVSLKGESKRSSSHTTEEPVSITHELPLQVGAGYTGFILPEYKITLDANYDFYSDVDASLQDGIKVGMGVAYEPAKGKRRWYQHFPVRAGAWNRKLEFKDKSGEDINEMAYTLGISFPLKNEISSVDLALLYLNRGSLETNKLRDRSLMLLFGFTGFDVFNKAMDRTAPREIPVREDLEAW